MKISKIVMYEFWCDNMKPKYRAKTKLCCTDTDSILVYIKTDGIYINISKDIETRFDTSN